MKDELWKEWVKSWADHVEAHTSVKPTFSAQEMKGLKNIRKYFLSQTNKITGENNTEDEALYSFQYILTNWNKLDNFKQGLFNTTYIASNLPSYIACFKKSSSSNILSIVEQAKRGL